MRITKKHAATALFLALLILSGCSGSGNEMSYISDPFIGDTGEPADKENFAPAENLAALSGGGFDCVLNNGEALVYKGGAITAPAEIVPNAGNETDITIGISADINGVPQKLTLDGKESLMPLIKGLKAGEKYSFELSFEPVAAEADKVGKQHTSV